MAEMALSSSGPSAVTVTVSPPLTPRPISFISWVLLTVLVTLGDGDLGTGEGLGCLDQQAGGTGVDAYRIDDGIGKRFHDRDSFL